MAGFAYSGFAEYYVGSVDKDQANSGDYFKTTTESKTIVEEADPNQDYNPSDPRDARDERFDLDDDVLQIGEQVNYVNSNGGTVDYEEYYLGKVIVDGIEMPVMGYVYPSEYTNPVGGGDPEPYWAFIFTPEGVDPTTINWPDNFYDDMTLIEEPWLLCFAAGTRIAVPGGCTAVENLKIGDIILTADGRTVPVKWIGRQAMNKQFSGKRMQPVRIRAGALGKGLPHTDLTVTGDHGMVIDDLVINASALVNGDTIDWVPMDKLERSFVVYHVETENHDVILANGAPTETFVDVITRRHFDNYAEYLDLYGVERIIPVMNCPRISARRLVPCALKTRLGIADHVPSSADDDQLHVPHGAGRALSG